MISKPVCKNPVDIFYQITGQVHYNLPELLYHFFQDLCLSTDTIINREEKEPPPRPRPPQIQQDIIHESSAEMKNLPPRPSPPKFPIPPMRSCSLGKLHQTSHISPRPERNNNMRQEPRPEIIEVIENNETA